MVTAKATKAADKSQVCRKLVSTLQKFYGRTVPKIEMPVVETMLFAACLEDNPWPAAESGLKKLLGAYFDLNEIRVSSITELEQTLAPLKDADWKGLRIRSILRYVFETTYSYDFEKLRRQTQEQAVKLLKKVNDITPFIRDFVLQEILGTHVVVLDTSMLTAARWLGLVPAKADINEASEFLRGGLKKSETPEFCHLLRCLATDSKYAPRFLEPLETELSMNDVADRFVELQSPPKKKPAKPAPAPEPPKPAAKAPEKAPVAPVSTAKPSATGAAKMPAPAAAAAKASQTAASNTTKTPAAPAKAPTAPQKSAAPAKAAPPSKAATTTPAKPAKSKPAPAKAQASKSVSSSSTASKARKSATPAKTKSSGKSSDKKITGKPKIAAKVPAKKTKR